MPGTVLEAGKRQRQTTKLLPPQHSRVVQNLAQPSHDLKIGISAKENSYIHSFHKNFYIYISLEANNY